MTRKELDKLPATQVLQLACVVAFRKFCFYFTIEFFGFWIMLAIINYCIS